MNEEQIDLEVAAFAIQVEVADRQATGRSTSDLLPTWCQYSLAAYSSEQLLESVHRHVKALTEADNGGELGVFDHHLQMLNFVADEIERRIQAHEAKHE